MPIQNRKPGNSRKERCKTQRKKRETNNPGFSRDSRTRKGKCEKGKHYGDKPATSPQKESLKTVVAGRDQWVHRSDLTTQARLIVRFHGFETDCNETSMRSPRQPL